LILAGIFQNDRLKLDDDEGQRLAETTARVLRWYDVPVVTEKMADHYAFIMAAVMVLGTRLMAEINERRKGTRPAASAPAGPSPGPSSGPSPGPSSGPSPGPSQPGGPREPPDPREWSKLDVAGLGTVDIPPLAGAGPH
jgi:hypothetical protein